MIPQGYYTSRTKALCRRFARFVKCYEPHLIEQYGAEFAARVGTQAHAQFIRLIPRIPFYRARSYQEIILINACLIAVVRAMSEEGRPVEETLRIQVRLFEQEFRKIPRFAGRVFVSLVGRFFLKRLAAKVTREGWNTELVSGGADDGFQVSVITRRCGVAEYLRAEGMTDILKYCNMSDFLMFPRMGIGLRQTSTIESGACTYCMKYGGETQVPDSLHTIY